MNTTIKTIAIAQVKAQHVMDSSNGRHDKHGKIVDSKSRPDYVVKTDGQPADKATKRAHKTLQSIRDLVSISVIAGDELAEAVAEVHAEEKAARAKKPAQVEAAAA